jgi:hypothetical protein
MHSWTEVRVPRQTPDVLAEVFGDEAVVVQLRTGAYYAFDVPATALWTQLWQGNTLAPLIVDDEKLALLTGFLRYLVQEELMQLDSPVPELVPDDGEVLVFSGIEKFTDMEDLLVLDPIHDIDLDGSGWPTVAEAVRD